MEKKYFRMITRLVFFSALALFISSCEDGKNGINGPGGEVGVVGENGAGVDDLIKNGAMTVTFKGKRADDVAFTEEVELKFSHVDIDQNTVYMDGDDLYFNVTRFVSAPDTHETGSIQCRLNVIDAGLETQTFQEFNMELDDFYLISDDLKFFSVGRYYNHYDNPTVRAAAPSSLSEFSLTDYSFDDATNNLKYSFSFKVAGGNNPTGNDLTISGDVDVIVLESLDGPRRPR